MGLENDDSGSKMRWRLADDRRCQIRGKLSIGLQTHTELRSSSIVVKCMFNEETGSDSKDSAYVIHKDTERMSMKFRTGVLY